MAEEEHVKEFPDVSHKLAAPKKLSAFEKERQAAEAKKLRAEAENAAALKAFEDSFADADDDRTLSQNDEGSYHNPPMGPRASGAGSGLGASRYNQGGTPDHHGGSPHGGAPLAPSLKRKRALDEMREQREAMREHGILDDAPDEPSDGLHSRQEAEADHADEGPRPTIQLSSLPPNMVAEDIKILLRDFVKVHSVRILPSTRSEQGAKRSVSAIATLSAECPTMQIDAAVSALKDKYLGCGFRLSLSRHLSSAALHPSLGTGQSSVSMEPFGAEKPRKESGRYSMRNAPPPMDHRGFAPPESYDTSHHSSYNSPARVGSSVTVRPPLELETVRAIHVIVDRLLLEPDPSRALEIEALLMALPEVQQDERFSFLYDARSAGGIYYRFCLWTAEHLDDDVREQKRRLCGPERLFNDVVIDWLPPYTEVPFPDLQSLAQVVTDVDYISSDEESEDEDDDRKFNSGREDAGADTAGPKYLTPLQRARLVHLLSRLPPSNTKLRKGDIARITNFAIARAGQGAEEIVDLLLLNVHKPFSYSLASLYETSDAEEDGEDAYEPDEDLSDFPDAPGLREESKRDVDPSNPKLVALYVISDILSASSTAGARNAWKYRQLLEAGFKNHRTFEHLGKMEGQLAWGRLKAEQWKRRLLALFSIWEGWSVFPSEVHEEFKQSFLEPPLNAEEKAQAEAQRLREEAKSQDEKFLPRFKRVGEGSGSAGSGSPAPTQTKGALEHSANTKRGSSIVAANAADGTIDGAPLDDDDNDGALMDVDRDGQPLEGPATAQEALTQAPNFQNNGAGAKMSMSLAAASAAGAPKRGGAQRRMKAEDMFADSDEE